jgi:hypothetical protein
MIENVTGAFVMKRTFLSRLHRNGVYYLIGALLLLLGVPLFQFLVLIPQGYSEAVAASESGHFTTYLAWITSHAVSFVTYRSVLVIAFGLLLNLPFTLFRIIVAQEILGPGEEPEEEESAQQEAAEEKEKATAGEGALPIDAWRGKGYAVIAAWSGLFGIILYALGTLAGTIYAVSIAASYSAFSSLFTIIPNTAGGGLLALACLFFGAVIARRGLNLWPGIWVAFGYVALALAALFSGSAVAAASSPQGGQAALTTAAILGFAIWVLWFGVMLVRLKPE